MKITAAERARGWVEFICPDHGVLVVTTAEAEVTCRCKKRAYPARDGKRLHREQLKRIKASQ